MRRAAFNTWPPFRRPPYRRAVGRSTSLLSRASKPPMRRSTSRWNSGIRTGPHLQHHHTCNFTMQRTLALLLLAAGIAPAQEKTAIQTAGEEVLVDVVVRDKKGHAVTSLPQSSFTVTDDGAPRPISSFRLIRGTEAISATGGAPGATQKLDPLRQIRLVSLIFDRLDQGERFATRRAAQ